MTPDFYSNVVKLLPNESLQAVLHAAQLEIIRRSPSSAGQAGRPGPSYQDLVNRYGLDGNAQLGYQEISPRPAAYLLSELPFKASYDNDLNAFVYSPKNEQLKELKESFSSSSDEALRELVDGEVEILIEPTLVKTSSVKLYNPASGKYVLLYKNLAELVSWYIESTEVNFHEIPYIGSFYLATADRTSMLAFGDQSMITEVKWKDYTIRSAPFKTGATVNVQGCSNIPQLVEDGVVPVTTHIEQYPIVKSVFAEVGGSLIRVMTGKLPYSRFTKSHVVGDPAGRLELHAAVNITRDMTDCFGNVIPWTAALNGDGLDLEIALHGSFNNGTGFLTTGTGTVNFTAHDQFGEVLCKLLKPTAKVHAYDLDATLVEN